MSKFNKPKIRVGDIVRIEGYGHLTFEVYAVHADYYCDAEFEYIDTYYDCYCEQDGEYYYADDAEIKLLERPVNVNYRRISDKQTQVERKIQTTVSEMIGAFKSDKPTRSGSDIKQEIDELLTEWWDVRGLIELFGEEGEDRRYKERLERIESDISKLAAKVGKWRELN